MATPLCIASYNCKHFGGSHIDVKKTFINGLFQYCDIIMLQEHWLYESQFHVFDDIMPYGNLGVHGSSAMDPSVIRCGRPHGGCVILWRESTKLRISYVETISTRLNAVIVFCENVKLLLINVYMPCDMRNENDGFSMYQDVLAEIAAIIEKCDTEFVIIAGDFNTDFARHNHVTDELINFCEAESLTRCSILANSDVSYTFESVSSNSRSHIDHMFVSENLIASVLSHVAYDSIDNASDHLAIITQFNIKSAQVNCENLNRKKRFGWYKASPMDIELYKNSLDHELSNIVLPDECLKCCNVFCNDHICFIESFCNDIINACIKASGAIPQTGSSNCKTSIRVPGWNEFCKDKHKVALYWHNIWKDAGRPREGHLAELRRKTRLEYHRVVKCVRKNENMLRSERMAKNLVENRGRHFWNEVRVMRGKSCKYPSVVDNVEGKEEIAELFASKFKSVFNSVGYDDTSLRGLYDECNVSLNDISDVSKLLMSTEDVKKCISKLKSGKSDGNAGLFSDNFIFGSEKLFLYLKNLFNLMIVHGVSPDNMLIGTMIPIPKNKKVNKNSSDNFRGICLQSMLCKILDMFMLDKEQNVLSTSDLQFGFKTGLSTDMAAATVLETIDYYVNGNGRVFMLALDATKAFDRVGFVKLFRNLYERNVNPLYIRLLYNLYTEQKIRVNFNGSTSDYFNVRNGVKQGGVLSPLLFSCYIDGLIQNLQNCKLGCHLGDLFVGCVAYADDVVLLAPSMYALKEQVKIAESFANDHSLIFNGSKSKLMYFGKNDIDGDVTIEISGEQVSVSDNMTYLGHDISSNIYETGIKNISRDFVVKFNSVLSDFSSIKSSLRYDLMLKYCTSFYGVMLCDLSDRSNMERLYKQWRKAIRRIWRLPMRTHSRLLPLICKNVPIDIILKRRFWNFFKNGMKSKNHIVSQIFRRARHCFSHLGRNFRSINSDIIKWKYKVGAHGYAEFNLDQVWYENVNDDDIRGGSHIRELVDMRDSIQSSVLNRDECQSVIDFLCTS